ncbi:MAG: hypothetical protein ABIU63_15230 [Chitinophagaceae bacterium]
MSKLTDFLVNNPTIKALSVVGGSVAFIVGTGYPIYKSMQGKIKISGQITASAISQVPVNAIVKISSPIHAETDTDKKGVYRFQLEELPTDSILIVVQDKKTNIETQEKFLVTEENEKNIFNVVFNPDEPDGKVYKESAEHTKPVYSKQQPADNPPAVGRYPVKPTEAVNNAERADFAVMTTINGKQNNALAKRFTGWLKSKGSSSVSILQNVFIEQNYFNQVMDGNSTVIKKSGAATSSKYICLARTTIDFSTSDLDASLIIAKCFYEIMIIESATAKIIDSFEHTEKGSGISEDAAKKRAEDDFFAFLNNKPINF